MSFKNNTKIVLGSVSQSLDKLFISGKITPAIIVLSLLHKAIDIAYNLGQYSKVAILQKKVDLLKFHCSDICMYKDKLIYVSQNTPPKISDNIIEIPFDEILHDLPASEVIYNYQDLENNFISNVVIVNNNTNLFINNLPVTVDFKYGANATFKANYNKDPDKEYIIKNKANCETDIMVLDRSRYTSLINDGYNVLDFTQAKTVLQKIEKSITELPNDTILYVHIDTTSMSGADQLTLKNVVLEWWNNFYRNNPSFAGSLLINTVRNDQIPNSVFVNPANNFAYVTDAVDLYSPEAVECWLKTPAIGLLRQAYKEGITTFNSRQSFYDYIATKSLVVLAFIDETNPVYHGSQLPLAFNSTGIVQPTNAYVIDYENFLEVQQRLTFFKGVLYPIIKPTQTVGNFLLQSIAAIEARDLTDLEVETLVGPQVIATLPSTYMVQLKTALKNNVYKSNNLLKQKGWSGNFTKVSPADQVFTSTEFEAELNDLLTSTSNIQTAQIKKIELDYIKLNASSTFSLKVQDNHPFNPLYSNVATIMIKYVAPCVATPTCGGIKNFNIFEDSNLDFSITDFDLDGSTKDKVIITSIVDPVGNSITFNGIIINQSMLPIIFTVDDILNGQLLYTPNETAPGYQVKILYKVAYKGDFNYCTGTSTLEINKINKP